MKKTIYIFSHGEIQRKDNTLFFEGEEGKKFIPVEDTQELMLFGEVSLNKKALEFFSQKEIILHYFNHYGYYMGTFYPREHLNSGFMIIKQAEHYIDEAKRLALAKNFVQGAIQNILKVLKYYQSRGKELSENIEQIEAILKETENQPSIPTLMAKEGEARQVYYQCFDLILADPLFTFDKRTKRPPKNQLNTLISFLNSLLYVTVLSEIYQTHLDPKIGFLHTANFRRFSLNLDVAEIFKPIIVDRVIFTLIGKKMLDKSHFDAQLEGLLLNEKGRRIVVTEYESKLKDTLSIKELGRKVSYRRLIRMELYKLEKHFMGEKEYSPYISKW